MRVIEATREEFSNQLSSPYVVFNSASFNELNRTKAERIYYLLFMDTKLRMGLIAGEKDGMLKSPFSAPFGGFSFVKENISVSIVDGVIESFCSFIEEGDFEGSIIVPPPIIYNSSFITKQFSALFRSGFQIEDVDQDHFIDVTDFHNSYFNNISSKSRQNIRKGLKEGLNLKVCKTERERQLAYSVIERNRKQKGYYLSMSREEVFKTSKIVDADYFILMNGSSDPVAAAIIYHVSKKMVQVIYWGDLPEYEKIRPMNVLAFKVFEHYARQEFNIIHLGTSSINSIPNYGLSDFKESVGCNVTPKLTMKFDKTKSVAD